MRKVNEILKFSRYVFLFAHPDEEIYTCAFIADLVEKGKAVDVVYVTSGDRHGSEAGAQREKEVLEAMEVLNISYEHIHFLHIPEHQLVEGLGETCGRVLEQVQLFRPDCLVSHDFEGGHNGHDAVSFCASRAAEELKIPLYVFPAYHGWPKNRIYNQFVSGRDATYVSELTTKQQELKRSAMAAHQTQEEFMEAIARSSSGDVFFGREVLRRVNSPMDYTQKPTSPVGYEFPGSKIHFEDFRRAIELARQR